jgi:hypothetical protein
MAPGRVSDAKVEIGADAAVGSGRQALRDEPVGGRSILPPSLGHTFDPGNFHDRSPNIRAAFLAAFDGAVFDPAGQKLVNVAANSLTTSARTGGPSFGNA